MKFKLITTIKNKIDNLLLSTQDCDGICDYCNTDIKNKCKQIKNQ